MYCLSWNSYKNNICNGFAQLQQEEEFVDMTLVAEGHLVKVHKNLLSLASPYIKHIIKTVACTHPIIFLANITHKVLQQILEYVYTGEVHVEIETLNDFIKAAKEFQLHGISYDILQGTDRATTSAEESCSTIIGESTKLKKRQLKREASGEVIESFSNVNAMSITLANGNDNNQDQIDLNNGNRNTAPEKYVNNIEILDNRTENFGISEAINRNVNDLQSDFEMTTSVSATNNQNMPLPTISMNSQSSDTPEILTSVSNIQLLDSILPEYVPSDVVIQINNPNNAIDTDVAPQELDSDLDNMQPLKQAEIDDLNNFDDLLKMSAQQNSSLPNSMAEEEQDVEICYSNDSVPIKFSLNIGNSLLQQYTVSYRGAVQMILNRYLYSMQYSTNGGVRRRWRCIDYRLKRCRAYVDTVNDKITNRKNCHTHPYHDDRIRKKLRANLIFQTLSTAILETKKHNNLQYEVKDIDSD
ncbi:protein tramtrack, alpha isoform [Bicyclus anynana]|uniref:Protein tramtrack, alpha isoform n=1 Tax=Bicyclus anynana TaxID=110368 RepID=A0A6J1MR03_BICAN|nr:protein tramtrack, alpha isoform [Bicyclus anynana]